uniref:Uncharacterized protein n=1 Tax=Cucumis melo TaxID=3656 RepID=A0A9I9E3Q7_CUCME
GRDGLPGFFRRRRLTFYHQGRNGRRLAVHAELRRRAVGDGRR